MTHSKDTNADISNVGTAAGSLIATAKKAYGAPVLTVYGSVSLLTQSGSQPSAETSPGSPSKTRRKASDSRVKENIRLIGRHPLGVGVYLFEYKQEFRAEYGHGRQFGVMAQEVENILPAAVHTSDAGYKSVDYSMLGIHSF